MKKKKLIASLCALTGMMALLAGMEDSAFAAETDQTELLSESATTGDEVSGTEIIDESLYPDWWDDEDPQNAKAYMQLYGEAESETGQPLLEAESSDASAYTTTWKIWTDSKFTTTYHQTFTHSETSAANRDICAAIDVSYHQGDIDWEKVREDGIEYVFLRIGYRSYTSSGTLAEDSKFQEYMKGAQAAGIKVGVYFFSQAITEEEAVEEAEFVLNKLSKYGYSLDLPIAFDPEDYGTSGRYYTANLSKSQKTACAEAFCQKITSAGYPAMVYSSSSWFVTDLDAESLGQNYGLWLARGNSYQYDAVKDAGKNRYSGQIDIWQCSSYAKVDGIDGRVDLDWIYMEKDGFCCGTDGNWYYMEDGKVQTDVTSIIYGTVDEETAWWYVKNGKVSYTTTVAQNENGWWYVENGKVNFDYSGVAQNANGWWRIENGKVNFNFTGFAENTHGWWYLKGGKVQFSVNDILLGTVKGTKGWWHVVNGQVIFDETVAQNANGWWYVKDGMVDFTHYGVEQNANGWWRIEAGKVNFNFNGFAENANGWWYLTGGQVRFSVNDVLYGKVKETNGWWHVVKGQVIFDETVAQNANGWWRIENGKVNFAFNGFAENANGWWYLKGGKVDFTKTDILQGTVNGESGWWYVKGGKVQLSTTTVEKNANGWWYVENGKVNFEYTGIANNANGWWRIENGKVNFTFTGLAENANGWWYLTGGKVDFTKNDILLGTVNGEKAWWYISGGKVQLTTTTVAHNANGWWYVKDGKVDFTYTGVAENQNGTWYIVNGKVSFETTGTVTVGEKTYTVTNGKVVA